MRSPQADGRRRGCELERGEVSGGEGGRNGAEQSLKWKGKRGEKKLIMNKNEGRTNNIPPYRHMNPTKTPKNKQTINSIQPPPKNSGAIDADDRPKHSNWKR